MRIWLKFSVSTAAHHALFILLYLSASYHRAYLHAYSTERYVRSHFIESHLDSHQMKTRLRKPKKSIGLINLQIWDCSPI